VIDSHRIVDPFLEQITPNMPSLTNPLFAVLNHGAYDQDAHEMPFLHTALILLRPLGRQFVVHQIDADRRNTFE